MFDMFKCNRLWIGLCFIVCVKVYAGQGPVAQTSGETGSKLAKRKFKAEKPEHPFKVPDGASGAAWKLFLENKFKDAEAAFQSVIKANPKDLAALEGLRSILIYEGRFKEAQQVNLDMVRSSTASPLCSAFLIRAMDAQVNTENRAELLRVFLEAAAGAAPYNKMLLMDLVATLQLKADRPEDAKKALVELGYVNTWQFVCGPFGARDGNNRMDRRFAPERFLKDLAFKDERGKKVIVRKNVPVPFRNLSFAKIFPGARGVFYAFSNLESDQERDVLLLVGASRSAQIFLRGLPIMVPQYEKQFGRRSRIIRTRLVKGSNPLLVKLPFPGRLAVRVLSPESAPVPGVKVKALTAEQLARHEVKPVRGLVFSSDNKGSLATHFLKMLPVVAAEQLGTQAGLQAVVEGGLLNVAQAKWLAVAAQSENDQHARNRLARVLVGSFPDSAAILDTGASLLASVGRLVGHTPSRHIEEARQMRERGLQLDSESHQHLLGLYYFFNQRSLKEQAFEKLKTCVKAHPKSAKVQATMGQAFLDRNMKVLAKDHFEKAATLDNAYLGRLASFHEINGVRPRGRELREKMGTLGITGRMVRYRRYLSQGKLDEAEKILAEHQAAYPDRKDDLERVRAGLLLERGDVAGAYAIRKKLVLAQPKNRYALVAAVDLAIRLDKDDEAKTLLRNFLKEHPANFDLRRRLSDLENKSTGYWWDRYDIKVNEIDTSKFNQERFPRSKYAWIVDFMVTKINLDLSSESYVHIAQKVLNQQGINELSEVLLRAQEENMVMIRTLNPDGTSYQPENVLRFNLAQSASLYKVGPGSILEHAYITHSDSSETEPSLNLGFNFMALDAPRAVSRWIVMVPNGKNIKIRKIRSDLIEEKILPGPEGYTVYQWTNKKKEGIKVEPFMPREADQEVIPLVFVETPSKRYQASAWLQRRRRTFIPEEAKNVAREIVDGIQGERMQFEAIAEWVRSTIQPGKEARTLEDVWVLSSGNTGQMTLLAEGMAQAVGLNVHRAFVNASYKPGQMWRGKNQEREWEPFVLSAFSSGSRMLVLEPKTGPDVWLQFSGQPSEFFSLHTLFAGQAGSLALVLGDDGVRLKRVRGESVGKVSVRHRIDVTLDAAGGAKIEGMIQLFGFFSGQLRRALSNPQQAKQIPESLLRRFWPRIEKPEVRLRHASNIERPLGFEYVGQMGSMAEKAKENLLLSPFTSQAALLQFIGPGQRVHDLLIKNEVVGPELFFSYEIPAGHCWAEVPDDLFLCSEFGFYFADFNVTGRTLTCSRGFLVPQQRIAPEKYKDFQAFLNRIAETERQRIAFKKISEPGFNGLPRPVLSVGYVSHGAEKEEEESREKALKAEAKNKKEKTQKEATEEKKETKTPDPKKEAETNNDAKP